MFSTEIFNNRKKRKFHFSIVPCFAQEAEGLLGRNKLFNIKLVCEYNRWSNRWKINKSLWWSFNYWETGFLMMLIYKLYRGLWRIIYCFLNGVFIDHWTVQFDIQTLLIQLVLFSVEYLYRGGGCYHQLKPVAEVKWQWYVATQISNTAKITLYFTSNKAGP